MAAPAIDKEALYISFTRDGAGETHCAIVLPRTSTQVRFPLPELPRLEGSLLAEVYEAASRAAPALPEGPRVGIMAKVRDAPETLVVDGSGLLETQWDPARGRYFEESSIPFEDLMQCVELGEHEWRWHEFAGQDRCTRCQVLKDGSYIL